MDYLWKSQYNQQFDFRAVDGKKLLNREHNNLYRRGNDFLHYVLILQMIMVCSALAVGHDLESLINLNGEFPGNMENVKYENEKRQHR